MADLRNHALWAGLVVFTALVEATWLDVVRFQGVLPDLVLILVVYFALAQGEERAMWTGVLGGTFQDVIGNTGLGHHVICLVVVGFIVGKISHRLITDQPAVKAAFVFVAALLHGVLYTFIAYVMNPQMDALYALAATTVPKAFYTAIVTPLIFFGLDRTRQWNWRWQRGF